MNALALATMALSLAACPSSPRFSDASYDVVLPHDAPVTETGAACGLTSSGEARGGCSEGQFCLSPVQGYPNGYCAPDCLRSSCPTGTECLPINGSMRYCVRECTSNADCRTADGYTCREPRAGAPLACLPNDAPIGTRPDGTACYQSGAGDGGVGPFLPPLPTVTFTTRATSASRGVDGVSTLGEADPWLAVDPLRGGVLVGFAGYVNEMMQTFWHGGLTHLAADGSVIGRSVSITDGTFPSVNDVEIGFDRTARLHEVVTTLNVGRPGNGIRYLSSDDGGHTFSPETSVFTVMNCNLACSATAIAVGADASGSNDQLYLGTLSFQSDGSENLFFTHSSTAAPSFAPPMLLAARENGSDTQRDPAVLAIATGAQPGAVMITWVATNVANALSALGDPGNRVRMRVSNDAGATWGDPVEIARMGDQPVAQMPWVGTGAGVTHVVYVTGGVTGVWNVVLATRMGATGAWQYRVVNDDDPCATHAFTGMAVDPATGDAHIVWLDNRFGPGEVAYARCPADATQRCTRNELVSGAAFVLTTSTDPSRWQGTRAGVALGAGGTVWAAWSDTRSGGPGIYVAHGQHP